MSTARVVTENDGESALVQIALFDRLQVAEAAELLRPCCASHRWIGEMMAGRPYGSMRRLVGASGDIVDDLRWPDLAEALAARPRIGDGVAGTESAWSGHEQSGAGDLSAHDQLVQGNVAYQTRFGHAFLICATGRSAAEMLAALRQRLANPVDVERGVVREELRAVVRLRLIKTFR